MLIRAAYLLLLAAAVWACNTPSGTSPDTPAASDAALRSSLDSALTTGLLDLWYPRCVDSLHGGYFSDFDSVWQQQGPQHKMIVSQARHLWALSRVAMYMPARATLYDSLAAHGYRFLRDAMWDSLYGGFYQLVDREEHTLPTGYGESKRAYGQAFALYGLAAWAKRSGSPEVLDLARRAFVWLDTHARDSVHGGYWEVLDRSGRPVTASEAVGMSQATTAGYKDYNSSIHLLEAFAELYQVWPDSLLGARLGEMLVVVRDRQTDPQGYLRLYFTADWQPVSWRDSSRASMEAAHCAWDYITPGHDIETAYLLLEAAHVRYGTVDARTLAVARRMVDHSLAHGYDTLRGGIFHGIYYYGSDSVPTVFSHNKDWWAQAEALHSLLLFSYIYPDDPQYRRCFSQQWDYIRRYCLDARHGGWYPLGIDESPHATGLPKAQIWKTTYHTARALMGCLKMLDAQAAVPPVAH
ncbi:MAG: hypothetical protein OHK0039_18220 [Bacteroidia bacterium]